MQVRHARCRCGQLSLSARGEPLRVSVCHCLDCQRRTGSAFGYQARFHERDIEVTGRGMSYAWTSDEGELRTSHFCPDCGATIYYKLASAPDIVAVPVGAFADPDFPAPDFSVWESHRHAWVSPPDGADRHDGAPRRDRALRDFRSGRLLCCSECAGVEACADMSRHVPAPVVLPPRGSGTRRVRRHRRIEAA